MGLILDDNDKGVHAEMRRESFVLFSDFGDDRIELGYDKLDELKLLVDKIVEKRKVSE